MKDDFVISRLEECDAEEAISLALVNFGEDVRSKAESEVSEYLKNSHYSPFIYVVKNKNEVVGFIMFHEVAMHPNMQSFSWLCVKDGYRKYNLGRKLIEYAEKDTIDNIWKSMSGTFIGVSVIGYKYHKRLGYEYFGETHDGYPFVVKRYVNDK